MEKETEFYTATMASVYAEQGHWEKAAEIYRHLLEKEPSRDDYAAALERAEKKVKQNHHDSLENLAALFHQWFDLMLKYKSLQKLRQLNR